MKLITLLAALTSTAVFAQGPLTPPGAPAPTMKTLDEIHSKISTAGEKRTPISALPFTISTPGSYYLTGNLSVVSGDGITIGADCVTVDLNGFCISSTNGDRTGIAITVQGTREDLTIRNGHISGSVFYDPQNSSSPWGGAGFADGINLRPDLANHADNVNIDTVTVSKVGRHGIFCGETVVVNSSTPPVIAVAVSSNVRDCSVRLCGGAGVVATNVNQCVVRQAFLQGVVGHTVSNCSTSSYSSDGIVAYTASNCYGTSDGAGRGVAGHQSSNCVGSSQAGYGLEAYTASNCQGVSILNHGIHATVVSGCTGTSNNSTGIWARMSCSHSFGDGKNGIESDGTVTSSVGKSSAVGFAAIAAQKAFGCQAITGGYSVPVAASNFNN
jgi:hypothetical protein